MTVMPETPPPAPAPAPKPTQARPVGSLLSSLPSGVGISGLVAWVGGAAAAHGWHLSLPFLPTWLGLMTVLLAAAHGTSIVSSVWHYERGQVEPIIAAKVKAAELIAQEQAQHFIQHMKAGL